MFDIFSLDSGLSLRLIQVRGSSPGPASRPRRRRSVPRASSDGDAQPQQTLARGQDPARQHLEKDRAMRHRAG